MTANVFGAKFDHVAFAVPEKGPARDFLHRLFGGRIAWDDPEERRAQRAGSNGFRAAHVDLDGTTLEIIDPDGPGSFLERFFERRGPGLHHLTWLVDRLDDLLADLVSRGARLFDVQTRDGKTSNAFIYPTSAYGVLVQLKPGDHYDHFHDHRSRQNLPPALPPRAKLHHTTIAATDRIAALEFFQRMLGGEKAEAGLYGDFYGQELVMPGPQLGFISPAQDTSFLARFLQERGAGIHHVAFKVFDMAAVLETARELGLRLINPRPATGIPDDVFIHPQNPTGALIRLQRSPRTEKESGGANL